ncbi:MAG TPA: hypothetical protein VNE60_00240 [Gemmatimonadaceae bacterium]|nr:hypothetical protein [Gemmatimonadaceae bacterium]
MRTLKMLLSIGGASALLASPALGQARPLPPQKAPPASSMGSAGPARSQAQSAPRQRRGGYDNYNSRQYYAPRSYTNLNVPVMVGTDGLVYANFGNGYEQVQRQCTAQAVAPGGGYSTQAAPPAYTQPEITQPVPRAQTSSQAMIAQNSGSGGTMNAPLASTACWGRSLQGNVFVRR